MSNGIDEHRDDDIPWWLMKFINWIGGERMVVDGKSYWNNNHLHGIDDKGHFCLVVCFPGLGERFAVYNGPNKIQYYWECCGANQLKHPPHCTANKKTN